MPTLANSWWLLLWVVIPLWIFWWRRQQPATMMYSYLPLWGSRACSVRDWVPFVLRCLTWFVLVLAMARPQKVTHVHEALTRGIDIMLVLDTSTSMRGLDFKPQNRLQAAQDVIRDFVEKRPYDRIGAVVFAALAYTQCPLTTDHDVLVDLIANTDIGQIDDGTAIGLAVATAVKRLRGSDAESRIIILLSDGENNAGGIDPLTAAELAKTLDVKIYSIGVGKHGRVLYPYVDNFGRKRYAYLSASFNEQGLKQLASITGGQYFRAENKEDLLDIYNHIDQLEKTDIKINEYRQYEEYFMYLIWLALGLWLMELMWRYLWRRGYPE